MVDKDLIVELIPMSSLALVVTRHAPKKFRPPIADRCKIEHAMQNMGDKIQLRFSAMRKHEFGFRIGPTEDCDIQTALPLDQCGPEPQWCFLFDENGRLALYNMYSSNSGAMTTVSYNELAKEPRSQFVWLLDGLPPQHGQGGWRIVAECHGWDGRCFPAENKPIKFEPLVFEIRPTDHLLRPLSVKRIRSRFRLHRMDRVTGNDDQYIYLPLECLGAGGQGIVQRVFDVTTGEQFAMKTSLSGGTKGLRKEMELLVQLDHPNVVKMKRLTKPDQPDVDRMLLEYAAHGSLRNAHRKNPFSLAEGWEIVRQCVEALEHLHSRNVMHRDIKPDNILVFSRDPILVKMADFGIAKAQLQDNSTICGTHFWMAPEVGVGGYSEKADVWSLGIMIRGIMHGNADLMHNVRSFMWLEWLLGLQIETTGGSTSDACPLMAFIAKYMVVADPRMRISVDECKKMLFMGEMAAAYRCCKLDGPMTSSAHTSSICIEDEENTKAASWAEPTIFTGDLVGSCTSSGSKRKASVGTPGQECPKRART